MKREEHRAKEQQADETATEDDSETKAGSRTDGCTEPTHSVFFSVLLVVKQTLHLEERQ